MSRTYRALTTLALSLALVGTTAAVALATPPTGSTQDVNAQRKAPELAQTQAARKALYQSELAPTQARQTQAVPAAPARDIGVVAIALLGLVGGLIGGAAVVAGTAASRRRHRVVAA
jgi:hypothetical protein